VSFSASFGKSPEGIFVLFFTSSSIVSTMRHVSPIFFSQSLRLPSGFAMLSATPLRATRRLRQLMKLASANAQKLDSKLSCCFIAYISSRRTFRG
jgi:hypothetical protein